MNSRKANPQQKYNQYNLNQHSTYYKPPHQSHHNNKNHNQYPFLNSQAI